MPSESRQQPQRINSGGEPEPYLLAMATTLIVIETVMTYFKSWNFIYLFGGEGVKMGLFIVAFEAKAVEEK